MTKTNRLVLFSALWFLSLPACYLNDSEFRGVGTGTLEIASTGEVVHLEKCEVQMPLPERPYAVFWASFDCPLEQDPFLEGRLDPGLSFVRKFTAGDLEERKGTGDANLVFTYRDGMESRFGGCEGREPLEWRSDTDNPSTLRRIDFSISSGCAFGDFALIREEL